MNTEWKNFENKFDDETKASFEWMKNEYKKIRVGRANPALVDGVKIEAYGVSTNLIQLANIQIPEPRILLIKPYDPSILNDIMKAIAKFNDELNPIIDGKNIRIIVPTPTEESRKKSAKVIKNHFEKVKIAIRNARKVVMHAIKNKEFQEGLELTYLESLEKLVKKANESAEAIFRAKEKELLTI